MNGACDCLSFVFSEKYQEDQGRLDDSQDRVILPGNCVLLSPEVRLSCESLSLSWLCIICRF